MKSGTGRTPRPSSPALPRSPVCTSWSPGPRWLPPASRALPRARASPVPPYSPRSSPVTRFPPDLQATSSPKDSSSSRPKLRTSSSRSRRSDRQMLDFTVPTLMSRISAISGSVRPS